MPHTTDAINRITAIHAYTSAVLRSNSNSSHNTDNLTVEDFLPLSQILDPVVMTAEPVLVVC